MLYRYFDLVLECSRGLPELKSVQGDTADLQVQFLSPRSQAADGQWFHHWYADLAKQVLVASVARETDGFRLRYPQLADFLISSTLDDVRCEPMPGIPGYTLRHLLLDSALPHLMGQRENMILHASAVRAPDGRGIAFVGDSGWGKSSLAAALHNRGFDLVADDCLMLTVRRERLFGQASYPGTRLLPDAKSRLFPEQQCDTPVTHYSGKHRLELPLWGDGAPVEIHELILLGAPSSELESASKLVRVARRKGAKVVTDLIARCFLLDIEDKKAVASLFRMAVAVQAVCPGIWSLDYPRDYRFLDALLEAAADPKRALETRFENG